MPAAPPWTRQPGQTGYWGSGLVLSLGRLREERAAGWGSRLSTREGVGRKELTCQELLTEASGEECFTANLKESRMFNI